MTVNQHGGLPGDFRTFSPDNGVRLARQQLDFRTTQPPEMVSYPLGCATAVGGMPGVSGDARDPEERFELLEKPRTFGQDERIDV